MTRRRALLLLSLLLAPVARADGPAASPGKAPYQASEELLKASETAAGEPLVWPAGRPQVRTVIVTLQPGESTAKHIHGSPLVAYVLQGTLRVAYDGIGARTYAAGESFVEALAVPHVGTNVGSGPVRILAVFVEGAAGKE